MEKKRFEEIKKEAERRLNEWLSNSSFDEMSVYGSRLRFEMSLAMVGYPFQKKDWMKNDDFERFITDEEYNTQEYDGIIQDLFDKAHRISNS